MIPSPLLRKRTLGFQTCAFGTLRVFGALHRKKEVMG